MVDQLVGYVAGFVVVAIGMGLPRWFAWRRRFLEALLDPPGDASHV